MQEECNVCRYVMLILETAVLALKVVEGAHEGENLSKYVIEVIIEWGIASKLGYFNWIMRLIMI
jgi:hypothetical protein